MRAVERFIESFRQLRGCRFPKYKTDHEGLKLFGTCRDYPEINDDLVRLILVKNVKGLQIKTMTFPSFTESDVAFWRCDSA